MLLALYKSEVMYVDSELNRFLEGLGDIYDSTYIIVTADHGEEFREHGRIGHALPQQKPYEELVHVPLIIRGPELRRGIVVDRCVRDISPTILDLVGIPAESKYRGRSLFATKPEKVAISESYVLGTKGMFVSLRTSDWKCIMDVESERCELYYLKNDPREKINLCEEESKRAMIFRSVIKKHIAERAGKAGKEREVVRMKITRMRGRI